MGLEKGGVAVHHLRLDPQSEVEAALLQSARQPRQTGGEALAIHREVAQSPLVAGAPAEPAVVEDEELRADRRGRTGEGVEALLGQVEVHRLPGVDEDGALGPRPAPGHDVLADEGVHRMAEGLEAGGGVGEDRLGGVEGLARLEGPGEALSLDAREEAGRGIGPGLEDRLVGARPEQIRPVDLATGLVGAARAHHREGVRVVGGDAGARGDEGGPGFDGPPRGRELPRPRAREGYELPFAPRKVELVGEEALQPQRPFTPIRDPRAHDDDVTVLEGRVEALDERPRRGRCGTDDEGVGAAADLRQARGGCGRVEQFDPLAAQVQDR